MNHVMVDIETLGTRPTSVILSIGACYFDPSTGQIGNEFHMYLDRADCERLGMTTDPSTLAWWARQGEDAQAAIEEGAKNAATAHHALTCLGNFLHKDVQVWGNGATFDNVIIKHAYEKCGMMVPWAFWNDRDVRTIVELGQQIGLDPKRDMPFQGVKHDALADAKHQAAYVSVIWQRLTGVKQP